MTQSTEQERAAFEVWWKEYDSQGVVSDAAKDFAFDSWQAARRAPVVPHGWLPTAESINELPEPLRKYICDLETSCDPSGMVRHNTILRDQVAGLQVLYRKVADAAAPQPRRSKTCNAPSPNVTPNAISTGG